RCTSVLRKFTMTEPKLNASSGSAGAHRGPAAPQQRFQQLERLEWFAKIVICAELQAQDFVDYLATRRQHQNRSCDTLLAQIAAHIKAAFVRQHDVQNDQVEVAF